MYETATITVRADDGQAVRLTVPAQVPGNERAEQLRRLWAEHVVQVDGHWKGRVMALVPVTIGNDVAEAMEFHGAIVDEVAFEDDASFVRISSAGYWAHGF